MGTITLVPPVAATGITAAIFSNAYTIIQNVANGNLDNTNFASGAIFDSTKLMQNGADTRHVVGWNGSQWQPQLSPTRFFDSTLSGSAASIDIPNIPQTHQGLLLLMYLRGDFAGAAATAIATFNNDSGSNYDRQFAYGSAATITAGENFTQTSAQLGTCPANTAGANLFGIVSAWIPHYAGSTNNKVVLSSWGHKQGTATTNLQAGQFANFWRSNAAITRVTVLPGSGNWVTGSRLSLYLMP